MGSASRSIRGQPTRRPRVRPWAASPPSAGPSAGSRVRIAFLVQGTQRAGLWPAVLCAGEHGGRDTGQPASPSGTQTRRVLDRGGSTLRPGAEPDHSSRSPAAPADFTFGLKGVLSTGLPNPNGRASGLSRLPRAAPWQDFTPSLPPALPLGRCPHPWTGDTGPSAGGTLGCLCAGWTERRAGRLHWQLERMGWGSAGAPPSPAHRSSHGGFLVCHGLGFHGLSTLVLECSLTRASYSMTAAHHHPAGPGL